MKKISTILVQAGSRWDDRTGAVSMPVYHSATFRHPALGQSTGYDYSRTANPTRSVLEHTLAEIEGGTDVRAFAFASGLAAVDAALSVLPTKARILATEDLYGGTFRLLEKVLRKRGLDTVYVDTTDLDAVRRVLAQGPVAAFFIEVPSNPLLKVADLAALSALAREHGACMMVDNTFMTACRQRPMEWGADLVIYSATKYLGGHDDVVAGAVVARGTVLADQIAYHQNAVGAVLGPQDAWLLLRGLKTLPLRLACQEANALALAEWLQGHPHVSRVHYPGLPGHPGHDLLKRQATGFGAMISFEVADVARIPGILSGVKTFSFAESLGGVHSLITYPAVQTHADMDLDVRTRLGIHDRLLRLSVGIEDLDDLKQDLEHVLSNE